MRFVQLASIGLILSLLCGCGKPNSKAGIHSPYVKFTQYTLGNGLRVILAPDQASTVAAISITYDVGSRNERRDQSGLAHLCEHLMFKGSQHVGPGEHLAVIQSVGGYSNAGPTKDRTTYYEALPPNQLPLALFLEADRLRNLDIRPDRVEQVRSEVLNEKREDHDDVAYDGPLEKCQEMVYGKFPYGHAASGTDLSISTLTLQDVQQFFKTYYAPSHAALCICGRFDPAQARALINKYFASIPSGKVFPMPDCSEQILGPKPATAYIDGPRNPQGLYVRGYATVSMNAPDYYPLLLTSSILTSGNTSRLHRLVIDRMGATSVLAFELPHRGPSLFGIRIKYPLSLRREELAKSVENELERIADKGVTQEEVDKACALEQASLLQKLSNTQDRAKALSDDAICEDDPGHVNSDIDIMRRITPSDIQRVVRKYLSNDRACEVFSYPGAGPRPASLPLIQSSRKNSPPVRPVNKGIAPVAPFKMPPLPVARVVDYPNGLRLVLMEDHRLPAVTIHACVSAGFVDQPRPGIATLTGQMLAEGTASQTRDDIYGSLEKSGASLYAWTSMDYTDIKISGLSTGTDGMLSTLSEILQSASCPPDRLSNMKSDLANTLLDHDDSSITLFRDIGLQSLLHSTPYLQKATRSYDLKSISRDDILSFYSRCYRPNRTILAVSGDIHPEQLTRAITSDFSGWKRGDITFRPTPAVTPSGQRTLSIVDWSGEDSSSFDILCRAPRDDEPDFAPFRIAVQILAAGPSSHLYRTLRWRLSETYSVWQQTTSYQTWSYWECNSAVRVQDSAGFYKLMYDEVAHVEAGAITPDELEQAKRNLIGEVLLNDDSPDHVVEMSALEGLEQRAPDYTEQFIARLQAVKLSDVQRVAKKYLAEDRLSVIAIGPRKYLEAALSPYGHVDILDASGRHVK